MLRGDGMEKVSAEKAARTEIKLAVNRKLYQRRIITEELYRKARELILKGA